MACEGCPSCCNDSQSKIECCQRTWCALSFLGLILLVSLLPASFVYFEYNEMGFVKYTITNNVDTNDAYTMGRIYTGPSHAAVVFPRDYQRVDSRLAIFPDNGQEFYINLVAFFRLNIDRLPEIYEQFGTSSVSNQASIRIDSEVKSIAPTFAIEDYILIRELITEEFFYGNNANPGLQEDLDSIGVVLDLDKFWLAEVEMPASIEQRNLDAAVQLEVNAQEENEREAILVQTETDRLEQIIIGNITRIDANAEATVQYVNAVADATIVALDAVADAQIKRVVDEATSESSNMIATVEGGGLEGLFSAINVTDKAIMYKYIEYFALLAQ